jgi:hypothetical protein
MTVIVRGHIQQLQRSLRHLKREGFREVHVLSSVEEVDAATVERRPLWTDRRNERCPFDSIGDVHGCYDTRYSTVSLARNCSYSFRCACSSFCSSLICAWNFSICVS